MARAAAAGGTTVMLATPHRRDVTENFSIPHLRELAAKMVDTLAARGVGLTLVLGMENHLDVGSARGALARHGPAHERHPVRAGGAAILRPSGLRGTGAVRYSGERHHARSRASGDESTCFSVTPACCSAFVERGMLTQVTAGSVTGLFGDDVKRLTHSLLRRGLVHMLASDTHAASGPTVPGAAAGDGGGGRDSGRGEGPRDGARHSAGRHRGPRSRNCSGLLRGTRPTPVEFREHDGALSDEHRPRVVQRGYRSLVWVGP